jgi:chemotaxis protein methyltransferase CheR
VTALGDPMSDKECVAFLQWALPQMELRWAGFRKVRRQVCKRIKRRMKDLGVEGFAEYRSRLEKDPSEWQRLDELCRITISKFYRDADVFQRLRDGVLTDLARRAAAEGRTVIRCWSAGCASGEEAYTLAILWGLAIGAQFPSLDLSILGTDTDENLLSRARAASYERSSLGELPEALISQAFDRCGDRYNVRPRHRQHVAFLKQDLRREAPPGLFDLVLCRNLAFTYFAPDLQRSVLARIAAVLARDGYLVIGAQERLPDATSAFERDAVSRQILRYRR